MAGASRHRGRNTENTAIKTVTDALASYEGVINLAGYLPGRFISVAKTAIEALCKRYSWFNDAIHGRAAYVQPPKSALGPRLVVNMTCRGCPALFKGKDEELICSETKRSIPNRTLMMKTPSWCPVLKNEK